MNTAQYFTRTMTVEELKKEYKALVKRYHPDLNPHTALECTEILKMINVQYEEMVKVAYRNEAGDNYSVATENEHIALNELLNELITLEGIEIEICGTWLWIGGNTFPVKDTLMEHGFKWSRAKVKWYLAPGTVSGKRRGRYSMEQIRNKYGSEKVNSTGKSTPRIG